MFPLVQDPHTSSACPNCPVQCSNNQTSVSPFLRCFLRFFCKWNPTPRRRVSNIVFCHGPFLTSLKRAQTKSIVGPQTQVSGLQRRDCLAVWRGGGGGCWRHASSQPADGRLCCKECSRSAAESHVSLLGHVRLTCLLGRFAPTQTSKNFPYARPSNECCLNFNPPNKVSSKRHPKRGLLCEGSHLAGFRGKPTGRP